VQRWVDAGVVFDGQLPRQRFRHTRMLAAADPLEAEPVGDPRLQEQTEAM
jgi:hypothetical protein